MLLDKQADAHPMSTAAAESSPWSF